MRDIRNTGCRVAGGAYPDRRVGVCDEGFQALGLQGKRSMSRTTRWDDPTPSPWATNSRLSLAKPVRFSSRASKSVSNQERTHGMQKPCRGYQPTRLTSNGSIMDGANLTHAATEKEHTF